jgi:glycosyltransferase involved in cell wall biosynthesis
MRIAILVDKPSTSAAPKIVGEEAYHMRIHSVEADVIVMKRREGEAPLAHGEHVEAIYLDDYLPRKASRLFGVRVPSFSFFSLYHMAYPIILRDAAQKMLSRYDEAIVHYTSAALLARRLRLRRSIFYLWDPISYIFSEAYESLSKGRKRILSSLALKIDREIISSFSIVILTSRFHLARIRSLVDDVDICIVYPGTHVLEKPREDMENYILSVARWEPDKKHFFLVDLAKRLIEMGFREIRIRLVGPWRFNTLTEFLRRIKKLGLASIFQIQEPAYGEELSKQYMGAKLLVHPRVEAFGFTGLEAASHGTPIVFPKGSGVTELFEEGIHGCFPRERYVDEYAQCIAGLLSDEEKLHRMGRNIWEAAKKYSWDSHVRELLRILNT